MASTTMSATTMEPTASSAVESATTAVETATTARLEAAARAAAKCSAALRTEVPAIRKPAPIEAPAVEAAPIEASAIKAAPKTTTSEATVKEATPETKPRSDTNEHAIHKVIRSPVAIRRTRVRRIVIVPVRAHRRWPVGVTAVISAISATYPDSDSNLSVRIARRKHANRQ